MQKFYSDKKTRYLQDTGFLHCQTQSILPTIYTTQSLAASYSSVTLHTSDSMHLHKPEPMQR